MESKRDQQEKLHSNTPPNNKENWPSHLTPGKGRSGKDGTD